MNYKLELISRLITYVDSFENRYISADIKEFAIYLKDQVFDEGRSFEAKSFNKNDYLNYKNYKEIELSTLLTGLFRFAKHYLKKTFQNTTFKTIDEFGFLANLLKEGSLSKHELIEQQHLEMSTGSEILKRMIKNGLIEEFPDEKDKRTKRVKLTKLGKSQVLSSFDDMYVVSKIIRGNITEDELNQILFILNKLNYFHENVWSEDRSTSMNEIFEKYIEKI